MSINSLFINPQKSLINNFILGVISGKDLFLKMNAVNFQKKETPKIYILMSIDCDVFTDSYALKRINDIFSKKNIKISIAATAKLVEENVEFYDDFLSNGHELVNHGYSLHSDVDEAGKTYSTFFYNKVDWNFIEKEILNAQEAFYKLFKIDVKGFRAPHFGVFQGKEEILKLYDILYNFNFNYSSSVMVYNMLRNNWQFFSNKIIELPVTNRVILPYSVIDSYSLVYKQGLLKCKDKFYKEFKRALDVAASSKHDMFINIYFDPSQMLHNKELEMSIDYVFEKLPKSKFEFLTYSKFIDKIKG